MYTFERKQKSTLLARLDEDPRRIIIVSGPRQTGKTTIVLQELQSEVPCYFHSVDGATLPSPTLELRSELVKSEPKETHLNGEEKDTRWLIQVWNQARERSQRFGRDAVGAILVLDEIQGIPNWSNIVKGLWDADRRFNVPLHVVVVISAPLYAAESN